jgi:hypothetical protein
MTKGRLGTAASIYKMPKCKHRWSRFERAGIFDPTLRRKCVRCGRIQTRKPKRQPLAR